MDSSHASVTSASIALRNVDTGIKRETSSGSSGASVFPFLPPGHYDLLVQKKGFANVAVDKLTLNVGDNKNIELVLKLSPTSEVVTVDGRGATINTTDGAVSTVIDRKFVETIPLNGRSFQDLILLTPGIVTQSPQTLTTQGLSGEFSINGQRTESNYYTVDGVSANTSAGAAGATSPASSGSVQSSTRLGTTQSLASLDELQEFRVNSSTYSAENGRTPGGQLSFITRSGSDRLHGSLYDYLRNNYFDANNWFSDYYKTPQPALHQNDFGGTLGGPIIIPYIYSGRAKSFFFFSYEGLRLTQPLAASLQYVPSLSLRADPNVPASIKPILNAFPLPTAGRVDHANGLADFIQAASLPSQVDATAVRLDHTFSQRLNVFFRFANTPSSSTNRQLSAIEPSTAGSRTYTLGLTNTISSHTNNEFRLGYVSASSAITYKLDTFGGAVPIDLPAVLGAGTKSTAGGLFEIYIPGTGGAPLSIYPGLNNMNQWNITDTISWQVGKNLLKGGIDYRRFRTPSNPTNPEALYIYTSIQQVLANNASASATVSVPITPIYNEFSAFLQDEYRVGPTLHVSFGLRWEVNPPPTAPNDDLPYTVQGSLSDPQSLSLAPKGTQLWKTTWYNFAPRLGVAWTPRSRPGNETVVRGGGGVFFDTGNETASQGYNGVGYSATQIPNTGQVPFSGGITATPTVQAPYSLVYVFSPHLQLPYTWEWSAAVQQAIGPNQSVTLTYVGANGRRQLEVNQFSIHSLNPQFQTIDLYQNRLTSNYNSLQAQFQRSLGHGLQALASYTWSHSIDFASNASSLPYLRGNSDFDVRHNLSAGASWQLPNLNADRITETLLHNWGLDARLSARTGFPVGIVGNQVLNTATGQYYYSGVNLIPNEPLYLNVAGTPGNREINKAAFSLPVSNQIGNAPRNLVRGFGAIQINSAVRRSFNLRESCKLEFRAEAFNILNHPNFGVIDSRITDATFGQATQTLNQSLTTLSSLYQTGGPRSMQFALRLTF